MIDQGLREIAALATAAQAFQVCTGRISYEAKTSESAARKQVSELKGAADLKDALNRFGTLGLGALTGISLTAADATPVAALAAGLGVWLLGSFSVSWARSTERNANRSVDYSFIRDNSLATLERDLPVVITRVRDAGLVPVFVIDELDKVDNAPKALSNLISRLKHLIADFGFFCFLVNRDCFDEIEARIRSRAYPAEHTLFSERLLLRPYPAYALRYLMDLVQGDMHDPQFALARTTFALNVMHHAQLNLTDMMRRLARAAKPPSSAIGTAAELTEPRKLVIATVQVAIDETLRSPVLAARMEEDSGFAQLAIDTLYDPSRSWAQNVRDIDPSKETLKRHLEQRMRSDAVCGDGRAGGDPGPGPAIESGDLEMLQKHLVMFLDLLGDLSGLRTRLGNRTALGAAGDPKPGDIRLADIPPADVQRICERLDNGFYRFLFYRDGDPVVEDPGHLNEQGRARAELLIPYAEAFEKLLATIGLSFDDVARTPLLRTVSGPLITRSRTRLAGALRRGGLDPDVSQYLSTLERFHAEIAEQRGKLGELLILIATLKRDVGNKLPVMPAIERLIPFDLSPEEWLRGWSGAGSHEFPLDAQGLESWTSDYPSWLPAPQGARLPPPPDGTTDRSPDDYQALAEPLIRYFSGARGADFLPVDYHFLLEAVRGRLPAAAMHSKFSDLTTGDWSRLAFAAAPRASRDTSANQEPLAPYWVFAAALRGLGFGKSALRELGNTEVASDLQSIGWAVESPGMTADHCLKLVRRLEATARERPSGLLVVETDEDRFGHEKPIERRPTLIIDRAELDDYLPVLNWLDAVGILTGQARGLAADTDDGEI
jgi:hypothetical protein